MSVGVGVGAGAAGAGRWAGLGWRLGLTGQMFSLGVPSSCTIRSTWWISDVPGRRGLWASSSARTQPMALQGRAGPHLTHLLGPLQRDPRRLSSALHLPCARVRTGWSPREGCMEWPHDWVQQASLGDHEGRAGILWPSVLCSHTAFWDPRLRRGAGSKDASPTLVPDSSCCRTYTPPPFSPHVNAGGLRGGSQQQFRGAVPAHRSTHLKPSSSWASTGHSKCVQPATGHRPSWDPGRWTAGLLTPPFL